MGEHVHGHGKHTEGATGAMTLALARDLQLGSCELGLLRTAQYQSQTVGNRKSQQQASRPLGHAYFQLQASQSQVGFKISEAVLDLHPLSVQSQHGLRGENRFAIGGYEQIPRLLESRLVIDDHIDRHLLSSLIEHLPITDGPAAFHGHPAEFETSALMLDKGARPTTNDVKTAEPS